MEKLKKHELKGKPPVVFIDTKEEIDLLNLNFSVLQSTFDKLKDKLKQKRKNKIKIDSLTKIRLLLGVLDHLQSDIEEIITSLDLEGEWTLTDEDINRINCNSETNKLFRTFLPYMLTYKILTDVQETEKENQIEETETKKP